MQRSLTSKSNSHVDNAYDIRNDVFKSKAITTSTLVIYAFVSLLPRYATPYIDFPIRLPSWRFIRMLHIPPPTARNAFKGGSKDASKAILVSVWSIQCCTSLFLHVGRSASQKNTEPDRVSNNIAPCCRSIWYTLLKEAVSLLCSESINNTADFHSLSFCRQPSFIVLYF